MSVVECMDALYGLIDTNKATLVSGLTAQNYARDIRQINRETLAPPREYYCMWIHVTTAAYGQDVGGSGASTTWGIYDCQIELADFAISQGGEAGLYETMGEDFALLLDRIVKLILDNAMSIGTSLRLVQDQATMWNRRIEVERRDTYATENKFSGPFFYGIIRFRVADDCLDWSGLY